MSDAKLQQLLNTYLTIYDSYHSQKEIMAYTVAGLYLAGAAALFVQPPFWGVYSGRHLLGFLASLLSVAALSLKNVDWQLRLCRDAGFVYEACSNLAVRNLDEIPEEKKPKEEPPSEIKGTTVLKFNWPKALAAEIVVVRKNKAKQWWLPSLVTMLAMALWTAIPLVRIVHSWLVGRPHV